ncbi:MAG: arsenate reductase family protein [Caulobacteraceae bacterium]
MPETFPVVIHHNPDCGASRNALAMIEAAGYTPTVVEYLKTGWARPQLLALLAVMNARPSAVLREKGTPAADLGLLDPAVSDDALLEAMVARPILVNRPIVAIPLFDLLPSSILLANVTVVPKWGQQQSRSLQ